MCLLKRDEQDQNCSHEECKNYYALNKQICVYNMSGASNNLIAQNALMNAQNPLNQLHALQQKMKSQPPVQGIVLEQESGREQKKKIKTEDIKEFETNPQFYEQPKTIQELQMMNQFQQANSTNRDLFSSSLLNNLLVQNTVQPQQDLSQLNTRTILLPFVQNPQLNSTPTQLIQAQFPQMMPQPLKPKATPVQSQQEIKTKNDNESSTDAFMKEFQTRILGLLLTQNKMMADLKERNEMLQDTLASLINEITALKTVIKSTNQDKASLVSHNPYLLHQAIGNSSETVTVEDLVTYLYGPAPDFHYNLVLKSDLELPLYRERNFKFTVILTDKNGNPVENSNRIPLTIGIYSSENPPKYIDSNTAGKIQIKVQPPGNKILKGFIDKDLISGSASFEKIQIKEVTSHFRNGWIFFVVYPKLNSNSNNTVLIGNNGCIVNAQRVKPLILEKVVVKAKKAKESFADEAAEAAEEKEDQSREGQ